MVATYELEVVAALVKEVSYPCTTWRSLPPPNPPVLSKPAVHTPTMFAAGICVKDAALPTNEVAVHTPVWNISPS